MAGVDAGVEVEARAETRAGSLVVVEAVAWAGSLVEF